MEATLRAVANALTLSRILAVPAIVYLVLQSEDGSSTAATIIFTLAALTDFIDGRLARATGTVSEFGRVFDPLADRIFISCTIAALTLIQINPLPMIGVAMVICRDIFMILGYKMLEARGVKLRVTFLGKIYTAIFMAAILFRLAGWWPWEILFWLGVAGSILTGAIYTLRGLNRLTEVNSAP